ncbi:MAG: phosphonate C-P lyase system protein PhnG [Alphaproteobacteria bacterium]|nr:phosphonate C-P lyase system protein PhnG [Alphaproteobacteria bacterium]
MSNDRRARWLSILASSDPAEVSDAWEGLKNKPDFTWLKKPERGAVLLRGKISSDGAPFNFGEMTVTRCSVQLSDGPVGVAYIPGRSKRHAMIVAVLDGLLQRKGQGSRTARAIVEDLARSLEAKERAAAKKTQETRVNFTMSVTE